MLKFRSPALGKGGNICRVKVLCDQYYNSPLKRRFFHLSMAHNVIAFQCSSVIYPIYCFHICISETLCPHFQWRELMGYFFRSSILAIFKEY